MIIQRWSRSGFSALSKMKEWEVIFACFRIVKVHNAAHACDLWHRESDNVLLGIREQEF